ncbi:ligase-associated DNA damage response endonuclease PdeM [Falsirhodobacter algicola]|uniref:Ligase-associated DNA damage response endonuclease PdeM n=1 Tax=Falsirhodobacter algicola TaxID=2692330 RepID=A0A8J8SL86_9RHOB|nr:ligase-associated DNA damage response endonuclease PdeM [Falsirhodobacter algicola]QUS36805.1 ligase-associated DNA damage response endonuclease PdeM [Falsirhodobacter algicola]
MDHTFTLIGEPLAALASGALWMPARDTLIVSDLHLGKSERMARRGGALLPPYDARDTLARLQAVLDAAPTARIVCLGDSFDDSEAWLAPDDLAHLHRLMAGRDWVWIAGNHDPVPAIAGGTHLPQMRIGPLVLRHEAMGEAGEISGHFHPKARLAGRVRPCFVADARQVILPAFGTYTGGLWCSDPAIAARLGPGAIAILTGHRAIAIPCPRR